MVLGIIQEDKIFLSLCPYQFSIGRWNTYLGDYRPRKHLFQENELSESLQKKMCQNVKQALSWFNVLVNYKKITISMNMQTS